VGKIYNRFDKIDAIEAVPRIRIKYKDVFDLKGMYTDLHDYLVENNWAPEKDDKFNEVFYHHRWTQTGGEEIRWWWRLKKEATASTYYWWEMDMDTRCVGIKHTEIVLDGKKFKSNTGEIELNVEARIVLNPEWTKDSILKSVQHLFKKRIFWRDIDMHRIECYRDVYRMMEFLKTHFKLKKYRPEPEGEQFFTNRDFE